jgi:HK97 gp10 family phage protein
MPVTVRGVDETIALLKKWEAEVVALCKSELEVAADLLIQKAQSKARVDTGYMRDNIQVVEQSANKITVGSTADYSIFNEEGTRYMSPQPFMLPSAMEVEQEFIGRLGEKIRASCSQGIR